jgi:hypothetical protein
MSQVGETGEDLVTLRFEGAVVKMRIGLRARSGTVFLEGRLECAGLCVVADVASAHG